MRMVPDANGAGAYGEAAGLDAGLAESDGVRGAEFSRERRESKGAAREGRSVERESAGGASGSMEEFTAFHGAALQEAVYLTNGRAKRTLVYQSSGDGDSGISP